VQSEPPNIPPARGPLLWEDCGAQVSEDIESEPDWDMAAQPLPDYEVDQRHQLVSIGFTISSMASAASVQTAKISGF
jgi:hypothetical protein